MTDMPARHLTIHTTPRREPAAYKLPWVGTYTVETGERICDEIASGRTLERIAVEEVWAPSSRQMRYWMNEHAQFAASYRAAVHMRAEKLAQEVLDVADDLSIDPDDRRIMIAARQWLAGKIAPHQWGERQIIDKTVTATINNVTQFDVSHLTLDQIHAAEAALCKVIDGVEYTETEGEPDDDE